MSKPTATLTAGRDGGRPITWIAGQPQGFTKQYVFPPNRPIEVDMDDAAAILAGTIETGGRGLKVDGYAPKAPAPAPAAALASGTGKA